MLEAEGEIARFAKLLPEYKAAPEITRERLYIETMEKVLGKANKVLVDDKINNLMMLPLDQLMRGKASASPAAAAPQAEAAPASASTPSAPSATSSSNARTEAQSSSSASSENRITQERADAYRQRLESMGLGRG